MKRVVTISEEDYNAFMCKLRDALASLKREHVCTGGTLWAENRLEEVLDILEKEEE